MSDSDDPSPQPPQPNHSRPDKTILLAVLGLVLAAIPIAWAVFSSVRDDSNKSQYIEQADAACEQHRNDLEALGPEPWRGPRDEYTLWLKKRSEIAQSALGDWGDVPIPPEMEKEVKDAYFDSDAAVKELSLAVDWGAQGDVDRANEHIAARREYAEEATRKARSIGLNVCPLGI